MSKKTTISKTVYLEPRYIDNTIEERIRAILTEQLLRGCDQDHGYVTEISKNIKLLDNKISNSSPGCYFTVSVDIISLKPEVGSVYTAEVKTIRPDGFFSVIKDRINVYVPLKRIKKDNSEYKFFEVNKKRYLKHEKSEQEINIGDKLKIKIDLLDFIQKEFKCIGSYTSEPAKGKGQTKTK